MKRFILMLQFLTKLPLPFNIDADEDDFSKGIIFFPVVGLVIGLLLAGVYMFFEHFTTPFVAVAVVVVFEIFITGGLHLDGLADSFDGLYSYRDKERMLEIMKDSRVGTNGVLAIVGLILLKVAFLLSISDPIKILIIMPVVSRCMVVVLARTSKYARPNGMGGFFIGKTTTAQMIIALIITMVSCLILPISLGVFLGILLATFIFRYHIYQKIDGVTGDVLGSWVEQSEVLFLLIFCFL